MDLSGFIDVPPGGEQAFFDLNAQAHETVFNTLLSAGFVIEHYPLWVDEPDDAWLEQHYQEHVAWSVELGLPPPPNLRQLNMDDAQARASWLQTHYLHHLVVSQQLNL